MIDANMKPKDINESESKNNTRRHFIIEVYLNGLIEITSTLDFASDLYILYILS